MATAGSPDLYDAEVRAAGPAGTVVAWRRGTFHCGTALTLPRGARYTIYLAYRPARAEWGQRMSWAGRSHEPMWYRFVHRATPRQLAFLFPPPGHPYWTEATLAGTAQRCHMAEGAARRSVTTVLTSSFLRLVAIVTTAARALPAKVPGPYIIDAHPSRHY